ncbi:MAG: L,D-transpeptidase family protein [Pararhodobacter sp.]|nr:L,D-transpeptidase family protein [Pararhodobacter sp.]
MGRAFPCAIGRTGITGAKREGDGATPAGAHRITGLLYRPERIARHRLPPCAQPIRPGDLWCDDPQSPRYNLLTTAPLVASHENLRRADPLYDIVLTTSWNWPHPRPGLGSAIFIHIWRAPRHPTAGCVAFERAALLWIVNRLAPGSRLIVRGEAPSSCR